MSSPTPSPLDTLSTLIAHCRATLASASASTDTTSTSTNNTTDALAALHASATLLRAHITSLSVALRPPLTAGGVERFAGGLSAHVVPSLTAAALGLSARAHGAALTAEARGATDALLAAVAEFAAGARAADGDMLARTGVVWSAADRIVALGHDGNCGVVCGAVRAWQECVEDARAELRRWIDDDDDGDDDGDDGDAWDRPARKSPLDPRTAATAEAAVKKLKLVAILLGAAGKRRLTGAARLLADVARVDRIADVAKDISRLADDLGIAFYEGEDLEDVVGFFFCFFFLSLSSPRG